MAELTCKGAFTLGTACMTCSRCRKTIATYFGESADPTMQQVARAIMAAVHDALDHEEQAMEAEIASLRSQLETLKEALEPFAETLNGSDPHLPDEFDLQDLWAAEELTVGDLRRARAAINATEKAHSASVAAEEASEANIVGQGASADTEPTSGDLNGQ